MRSVNNTHDAVSAERGILVTILGMIYCNQGSVGEDELFHELEICDPALESKGGGGGAGGVGGGNARKNPQHGLEDVTRLITKELVKEQYVGKGCVEKGYIHRGPLVPLVLKVRELGLVLARQY